MALARWGTLTKSGGVRDAIKKQAKLANLKGVKKILIKFDPFEESSKQVRDFNYLIVSKPVVKANPLCAVKTEILSDRSEGSVEFDLVNGEKYIFKCGNLTTLEVFQLINQHITPLAPKEDTTVSVVTKSEKHKKKKK